MNNPDDIKLLQQENLRKLPPPELRLVFQPTTNLPILESPLAKGNENSPTPSPSVRLKGKFNISPQEYHRYKYAPQMADASVGGSEPISLRKKVTNQNVTTFNSNTEILPSDIASVKRVIVN